MGDDAGRILAELADSPHDLLSQAGRLRKNLSATRVHLLLEQIELRRRALLKFTHAERMFFTPVGLEQATDEWIAAYKASRFVLDEPVMDLCCGIGGDLRALGQRGPATGVERDPITALFAKANAPSRAEIVVADVADLSLGSSAWHIDPDRRSTGRRTTRAAFYEPRPEVIDRLLTSINAGAVKLAPAAELPDRWMRAAELEWISRGGECRQLVAWFGRLANRAGARRATIIVDRELQPGYRTLTGDPHVATVVASGFGRYLAEPDAAVLAAGLVAALAAEHGLAAIAPGAVYLTGDRATADPALAWFEIVESLPFDIRRLKSLLRQRGIGRLEIKKRGVNLDPERLRRQLVLLGDNQATLFLARRGRSVTAVLAQRLR